MIVVTNGARIRWLSTIIPVPDDNAQGFWQQVTASAPDHRHTSTAGLVPLSPAGGDPYVWLSRVDHERDRLQLILHVDEPSAAVQRAVLLGARHAATHDSLSVLASPGGLMFGITGVKTSRRTPAPERWPGGHRSILDQVCVDVPAATYDAEAAFLTEMLGWPIRPGVRPEFDYLVRQPEQALRVLLQRLDHPSYGAARTHVDLACDSVPDEAARHKELGASVLAEYPLWTTMIAPAGVTYCLTRRNPDTGSLD
jgi:hypothetical protein